MLTGRTSRLAAVAGAAVLCLAACTGNSGTAESTSQSASPAAASSSAAMSSAASSGAAPTASEGLTSVPGLSQEALDVMNQPQYALGQWAIAVRDIETGEQIVSLNANTLFEPASVTKTYSTGAAWLEFGPDSTVTTPVKVSGEVVDGTLTGDLVLVGKGDITMGGRTKPDGTVDFTNLDHNDANGIPGATLTTEDPLTGLNELAAQVKASGINEVAGDVIVDDRLWQPHTLVGNPVTATIINQNVIDFTTTATSPGEPANIVMSPVVAPWQIDNQVQTVEAGGKTEIKPTSTDEKTVTLTGTIAADSAPVVNVYLFKDPATYARTAFIEALGRAGVTVTADAVATNPAAALPPKADVDSLTSVAELTSLPLKEEITYINKISYNNGGEAMYCRLAVAAGSDDCAEGLLKGQELWAAAGLDTNAVVFVDGSGLAGNYITADSQVQLQTIMSQRPDAQEWRDTLPILGVDGSLATVQADGPSAGKVFGKTGTLVAGDGFNDRLRLPVKALGGYIDTEGGRQFAFAVISTNSLYPDINGIFEANDDVGKVVASIQQAY
jgi:D-alanyl-D-alanine carboxypeptidase/D-alanyl-D-alanine-endopeptidase (penicillin-binding protein 4)